jgi:hypothetical protein
MSKNNKARRNNVNNQPRRQKQKNAKRDVSAASAYSAVVTTRLPEYLPTKRHGDLRIKHMEFWHSDEGTTSPFIIQKFEINPGQEEVFPWLAPIAGRFESYKFHDLKVHYYPNCPTSTAGFVSIAIDNDADDLTPSSRSELLAMEGAVSGASWSRMTCHKPKEANRIRYVRVDGYPTDSDPRTSDCGLIFLSKGDQGGTSGIGSYWIEYDVELITPQLHILPPTMESTLVSTSNMIQPTGGSLDQRNVAATVIANNQIKFSKAGNYLLSLYAVGGNVPSCTVTSVSDGGTFSLKNSLGTTTAFITDYAVKVLVGSIITLLPAGTLGTNYVRLASYKDFS